MGNEVISEQEWEPNALPIVVTECFGCVFAGYQESGSGRLQTHCYFDRLEKFEKLSKNYGMSKHTNGEEVYHAYEFDRLCNCRREVDDEDIDIYKIGEAVRKEIVVRWDAYVYLDGSCSLNDLRETVKSIEQLSEEYLPKHLYFINNTQTSPHTIINHCDNYAKTPWKITTPTERLPFWDAFKEAFKFNKKVTYSLVVPAGKVIEGDFIKEMDGRLNDECEMIMVVQRPDCFFIQNAIYNLASTNDDPNPLESLKNAHDMEVSSTVVELVDGGRGGFPNGY